METTTMETETLRVWVGCLACYNAGRLVGEWVDASGAAGFVPCERVEYGSPHEEWWVMDHEGFGGLLAGECSPVEAQELAELIELAEADGISLVMLVAYRDHFGELPDDVGEVAERFRGEWESVEAYAESLVEDLGMLDGVPELVGRYFDLAGFARDLVLGGDISVAEVPGGVLVFDCH